VHVPLRPDERGKWVFDAAEMEGAFTERTKLVFLNTPQNPTGKVFSLPELEQIAALSIRHDTIVVSDEVYDRMVFDGLEHIRMASLPGMWERTVTLGSAGKTFSVTGWKIGWAVAPPALSEALRKPFQRPFARCTSGCPMQSPRRSRRPWPVRSRRRARGNITLSFKRCTRRSGTSWCGPSKRVVFRPMCPKGPTSSSRIAGLGALTTTRTSADISRQRWDFCRYLTTEVGVGAIPPSAFYSEAHKELARTLVRFCFCKTDETLSLAAEKLEAAYRARSGR